jgi:hypothetical protein
MAHRTVEGIGTAYYLPHEERFARELLAGGHAREVEVLHALKVEFDACLLPDAATAAPIIPDPEQMELV